MNFSWISLLAVAILLSSCGGSGNTARMDTPTSKLYKISGTTMGTSYNITSDLSNLNQLQKRIDLMLVNINHEVSTYEEDSFITSFNKADEQVVLQSANSLEDKNSHFKENFKIAREVFVKSQGYFDPTVMPLVNYWGFGPNKKKPEEVDTAALALIKENIGFEKVNKKSEGENNTIYLRKEKAGVQLDFSALAKGYAVDKVAQLLDKAGAKNYLVEIGGEVKVKGTNQKSDFWTIGINKPTLDAALNSIYKKARLTDIAMASSGNYRNYFQLDGQIYSHTMNPKTGFPERNEILSATVFAPDCIRADAYATACMVAGLDEARKMIESVNDVEAFFIYTNQNGEMSELATKGASYYIVD